MLNCSLPIGVTLVADGLRPTKSNLITSGSGVRCDQATWFSGRAWRGTPFHRSEKESQRSCVSCARGPLDVRNATKPGTTPYDISFMRISWTWWSSHPRASDHLAHNRYGSRRGTSKQARGITCPRKTRPYRSDDELVQQSEDDDKVA